MQGRRFCVGRDSHIPQPCAATRLRRLPQDASELSLAKLVADECEAEDAARSQSFATTWRAYRELEPSLLLGSERFGAVDQNLSAAPDHTSEAPKAHAQGPALLPAGAGGVVEHADLVEALEATARDSGHRGVTYASGGSMMHETYAALLGHARRLLSALVQCLELGPHEPIALQLTDTRAHIRLLWACALGGLPSLTVAVAPQLVPSNAVAAKLAAAVAMLEVRHVIASDDLVSALRVLLPTARITGVSTLEAVA